MDPSVEGWTLREIAECAAVAAFCGLIVLGSVIWFKSQSEDQEEYWA